MSSRSQNILALAALVTVAVALRLYGIRWGLPDVYEEAQPLKKAWEMWGWGPYQRIDLNPHFFNYPSLTIYLQFVGQGLLYLLMKLRGTVESTADFYIHYIVDKTPFYTMARVIVALLGGATVWITFLLARTFMRASIAIVPALLLAIQTLHISKSQFVEVDVPLTFCVTLSLWLFVRLIASPTRLRYALAGAGLGLAISTKYTAALLVLPLLVAHVLAMRTAAPADRPGWSRFAVSLGDALLVFVITSPFVLLDAGTFWEHFSIEREHMRIGHFGLDTSPAIFFYLNALAGRLLGWPAALLALSGIVFVAGVRRAAPAFVLGVFLVGYLAAVGSFAMKAERYLLPMLPAAFIFAGAMLDEGRRRLAARSASNDVQFIAVGVAAMLLAAPLALALPRHFAELGVDTRAATKQWIESVVPAGAFVATEAYGPELFGPQDILSLLPDIRLKVLEKKSGTPIYAVQNIPMFQVAPERSEAFYDLALYDMADAIVVSNAVRSRYLRDPERFRRQIAFYDSLDSRYDKVREFPPQGRSKSSLTIYRNPAHSVPFSERVIVPPPADLRPERTGPSGSEELFFYGLGLNYEMFHHYWQAIDAYGLALEHVRVRPHIHKNLVLAKTRCLLRLGKKHEAAQFLEASEANAPSPQSRREFRQLRQRILATP